MTKLCVHITCLFLICVSHSYTQSFRKDSLQFKVYTKAFFEDGKVKNIEVDKVFCDYCSPTQIIALKQLSIRSSIKLIKQPKYKLINGEKRLAIYIRVKREDFANLKEKDSIK